MAVGIPANDMVTQTGIETIQPGGSNEDVVIRVDTPKANTNDTALAVCATWAILLETYTMTSNVRLGVALPGESEHTLHLSAEVRPEMTIHQLIDGLRDQFSHLFPKHDLDQFSIKVLHERQNSHVRIANFRSQFSDPGPSQHEELTARDSGTFSCTEASKIVSSMNFTIDLDGIIIKCSKNGDLGMQSKMRQIQLQVEHVLLQVVDVPNPGTKIGDLELARPQDCNAIRPGLTLTDFVAETCAHTVIQEQASREPDAIAVYSTDKELTYGELDHLSNRLAHYLRKLRVGPEVLVPFCFEKSSWAVVSMLATLKAGGASVGLDANHPVARLAEVVRDSGADIVLTSAKHGASFVSTGVRVITIDESFLKGLPDFKQPPDVPTVSTNAAYVTFTSGTTGRPKGIVIEHQAICASARSQKLSLRLGKQSRVLQFAAYSFDISNGDILNTLMNGGCICIPSEDERSNDLTGFINRAEANWACITPSVAGLLNPVEVPTLKTMILCGEPIPQTTVRTWAPALYLVNAYGPAETTILCTSNPGVLPETDCTNLGFDMGSTTWIVNRLNHNQLLPLGSIGEILIGGPLLARGYLNDVVTTAASFIEGPSWATHLASSVNIHRFYKSGDLGYLNDDGSITFVGRKDRQVKIRGQRVELREVEHHLRNAVPPNVVELAAAVISTGPEPILVAFVCLGNQLEHDLDMASMTEPAKHIWKKLLPAIQMDLSKVIPPHMIPSAYIPLRRLPLTSNGKLDRSQLKLFAAELKPDYFPGTLERPTVALPTTDVEIRLRAHWALLLRVDENDIGRFDNFLKLGGDSLKAMKLVAACRAEKIQLSLALVFQSKHLADMAASATTAMGGDDWSDIGQYALLDETSIEDLKDEAVCQLTDVSISSIEDMYPSTPLQEGVMALSLKQHGSYVAQNITILPHEIDINRFKSALSGTLDKCPVLRTRLLQSSAHGTIQVVLKDEVPWRDTTVADSEHLRGHLESERNEVLKPGNQLSRFSLVLNAETHTMSLAWTIHHAVYDGWSMPLIKDMIEAMYLGKSMQGTPPFKYFIQKTIRHKSTDAAEFWKLYFQNYQSASFPRLPTSKYTPHAQTILDHDFQLIGRAATIFTLPTMVRAAWGLLVGRYTDSTDVCFASTLTGRNSPIQDVDKIIGPTFATVPIRLTWETSQTIEELLRSVQDGSVAMIPFEQTGLQNIQKCSTEAHQGCQLQSLLVVQPAQDKKSYAIFSENETLGGELRDYGSYAIIIQCMLRGSSATVRMTYDTQVVRPEQAQRYMNHLEHTIHQLATSNLSSRIRELGAISHADCREILQWNSTPLRNIDACVHTVFADQVAQRPHAEAISSWDGSFTYSELDDLSTRLAHDLRTFMMPETENFVPICFEKTAWAVVAIIATLKAGAAIVPLDPLHPPSRLHSIVEEANARVVLCSSKYRHIFKERHLDVRIVDKDSVHRLPLTRDIAAVLPQSSSRSPLYLIFTSGSTGKPKGVLTEHGAYLSSAIAYGEGMFMGPERRVLLFSSYSFDNSMLEIMTPLIFGACVCVLSDRERLEDLGPAMARLRVDWALLTPTVARSIDPKTVPTLDVLLLGGEAVETVDVDQWESHVRHRIISYGPTEASVISSAFVGVNPQTNPRNIGRPFNAKYWIVSTADHNKLVPIGASGELLIEGPILARGYLSAQLTAQAFVENPHWTKSVSTLASNSITDAIPLSRRFYKTGDVVYNDSDGNVIYLNRKDSQVKLRGQRIELGEVEYHILRLLPNIRTVRAHVIQQDSEDRQAQLVAFVVLRDTTASDAAHEYLVTDAKTKADVARAVAEIESHLMTVLPRYMVPSLFLPLRQLPSTTSLKTDLKRLTSIVRGLSMEEIGSYKHTEERDHKPLSPDELKMRDLWATVLQIDVQMLSSNDTFFAVGGDSVMAIRLAAACRTSGLSLSVSQIFQAPRLSDMAAMIVSATKTLMEDHITPFSLIDEGTAHDLCAQCAAQCNLPTGMIDDIYPCTPMQEAVIAASLKTPGAYIARFVFNLPNDVDLSRFQLAVEAVVAATPILRTRIFQDDSQTSFQAVLQSASIDWKHSSDPETAKGGLAPASSVLGAPMAQYDLVTRGSNSDCQFIWTMHHALYDGWSMALMRERIDQYYRALSTPPDNQPHFNRFVKYLSGIDYEATAQFWKTYLLNAARPTFPAVKIGHDVRASEIVGHKFLLESQDPSPRITLPTILYAAWGLLVQCYSASSDVTFGATLSGRDISLETVDEIVGPTMSTVPVRITIGETAEKVSDLLHAVQKGVTGLEEYQHYGISNIRRVSKDAQLACQFQSHIVVQPVDKNIGEVCSTWSDSVGDLNRFNSYALMIQCSFRELSNKCREVSLSASYDPVVLDHTHIRRILHQFAHISNNLIGADESTLISNIDLVSSEDREDLDRWNNPNRLNPQSLCIHDIFTRNACQTPDSLAVSSWDGDLTYRELENLSNSLCAYLVNKGVKRGDHLALCFERSKWMSIASLATLKAGAIMVPLDHKHPKLRLEAIITQVKAEIVLTCESLHGLLTSSAQTIVVDAEALEWTQWSEVNGPSVNCAEPQDTAVVLFTSGSTGVPKGFILDHKALCSSTLAFGKAMFMDASTRVFHFASHSFDAVVTEILVPLFFGGCTCVPTEKERLSKTAEAMQRMKINWAFLTPSVARLIDPTEVPTLKTLVLGGEACSSADIGQWHKHVEHLVNGYGPGECSVFSSAQIDMKPGSDPTNIGSTFNAHYWITRPNNINQLCPIGAIGELLIDGPILARGYLNSPEQTAGAFVEPPSWYNATPRSKLYRTGDLARYNLDGSVSYIGRLDNQVKLRGQRIELTDVEIHLLRAMPDLTTAVVEMIDVGGDDSRKRLVAFLRLTAECQHDEGLLIYGQSDSQISRQLAIATEILQRILPAYMVPSHCLLFKSFPLTRSGKTDRRELRKYATEINADQLIPFTSTLSTTRKVASSSEEILLQKHWAVVIGLSDEEIGVDDHFFYLGGDSIQAMHLVARLRKQNISLTVMDVFRNPLLQDMARTLTASSSSTIDRPMEPLCFWEDKEMRPDLTKEASRRCDIAETLIEDIYPTTQLQEGLMVLSIKQPGSYIARFVMNLSDTRIDVERFIAAWEETFLRMPILRTRIYDSDLCGSVQVVTKEHIRWLKSNDLNAYIKQDRASSMCLGSSLSRFALIRNGEEQHCVLTVHHALYDAWSFRLIVRNVNQLYAGSIPSPVGQFNKYVSHLHYSDSKALKEMQEFWRSQLDDARVPDFPSSSPIANDVQDVQASSACEMTFDLPIHRPRSCTVSTLIYAAWSLVISRYTGTSDVVFGAVMSGRFAPIPGIEEIGGPTINTIPLRHNIDFSRTVDQYLEAFQTQVTSIIPFQTHGLQQIQRITESTSEACRFRTLLTVQPLAAIEKNDEISIHPIRDECSFTAYPLAVDCSFSETKLIIEMAYDSRLIEEPQLMRIMHQLNHAILQLCSDGSRKLSTLELASLQDMRELDEWNSHDVTLSQTYIHDVLTTSALLHPHKQAIDSWDGKLTYEDLDHQSTQLANYLSNVGVGPEIMVPLCFERSMWFVVALFAVSKAGGVFVPLDPSTPIPRMKNIIDQSGSTMILCSSTCRDKFKSLCREIICVDSDSHWRQHSSSSKLTPYDSPQQAAYVIFTSGSTGNPKGCVVTHEAFCSQLVKITENHFDSNMRTLQFASYSFDGCLLEIIPTIAVSGCLCIPSDANRLDNIAEVISRMDASWAFLTPSMARILEPTGVPTLRNLLLGGEALAKEDVSRWVAHVELAQVYGPTEGVVICSRVLKMTENLHPNNIGKAYHANFWIVKSSDHDFLVPIGAVGELLIDSPVLARGYLHDEEKTAVSFIEGPAWIPRGRGPRRMYKTGDLVRYASDGSIIFVGRKDDQIKLRGIRIQLDEITYHLRCAFPAVSDVVVIKSEMQGRETLIAFLSLPQDPSERSIQDTASDLDKNSLNVNEATRHQIEEMVASATKTLLTTMPQQMIPSVFIPIQSIPSTVAGKQDRGRLRRLLANLTASEFDFYKVKASEARVQPSTPMESKLRSLWSSILRIDSNKISVRDSFFTLGGDSILAIKLVAACRTEGIILSAVDIFRTPSLSDMALTAKSADIGPTFDIPQFSLLGGPAIAQAAILQAVKECGVEQYSIADIYPCTSLQEGLIAISLKKPGAYMAYGSLELPRETDVALFKAAWDLTFKAYPILRTRIIQSVTNGFLQVVIDEPLRWQCGDSLRDYLDKDREHHMSLGTELSRYAMVQDKSTGNSHFVWTIHHALYDGWSMSKILQHVDAVYRKSGPVTPPMDFKQYIAYTTRRGNGRAAESYWRSTLQGSTPSAFPHSTSAAFHRQPNSGLRHVINLTSHQSVTKGFTTATIIRAAWALLVSRYTDSLDVVFGAILAGRTAPVRCIEDIGGPTISTVPIRIIVDPAISVDEYLVRVQDQATNMIPHEAFGVQNISKISAEAHAVCQFQNLLIVQPNSLGDKDTICPIRLEASGKIFNNLSSYTLAMHCSITDAGIEIDAGYDSCVISEKQMKRVLRQFELLITQLRDANALMQVSALEMVTADDHLELQGWFGRPIECATQCLDQMFEESVKSYGDRCAIDAWDGAFTYKELDDAANRLAQHLIEVGVVLETKIPLCFQKSRWAIVAMLAVAKAGGTFVPLDPAHPRSRLELIIDKIEAEVALCSADQADWLSTKVRQVITVDAEVQKLRSPGSDYSHLANLSSSLYIVFTSGSTGEPKGCVIEHRALCSTVQQHGKQGVFHPLMRTLQLASYSFGAGLVEILSTLIHGGCVCVVPNEARADIVRVMRQYDVSFMFLTPTFARLLPPQALPTLKTIILGSEPLTAADIEKWSPHVNLVQGYGQTECASIAAYYPGLTNDVNPKNVGHGMGARFWIVDPSNHHALAPLGAIGELLIEGPILARGYLNDVVKTDAAFIAPPEWRRKLAFDLYPRLYKTGDLASFHDDGSLLIFGRKDTQVKLRGQRVELGEVEYHLRRLLPTLRDIVVEVVEPSGVDGQSHAALVAFICLGEEMMPNGDLSAKDPRVRDLLLPLLTNTAEQLAEVLPAYMTVSAYLPVAAFPMTATGKIDRKRLRQQASSITVEDLKFYTLAEITRRKPTTSLEVRLQNLWATVLGTEKDLIGIDDNFFQLGGDSIIAIKLSSACRSANLNLPVVEIFKNPTLLKMAIVVQPFTTDVPNYTKLSSVMDLAEEDLIRDLVDRGIVKDGTGIEDVLSTTYMQNLFVGCGHMEPKSKVNYISLDFKAAIDAERLENACRIAVKQHAILRTVFVPHQRQLLQIVLQSFPGKIEHFKCDSDFESCASRIIESDNSTRISFGQTFVQFLLFDGGSHGFRFTMRISHAQFDGMSLPIILNDIAELYRDPNYITTSPGFPNFIYGAHAMHDSKAVDFYRNLLKDANMTDLCDRSKPASYTKTVNRIVIRRVPYVSYPSQGITFASLLKAAWSMVLAEVTGKQDIVFGYLVNGRNAPLKNIETIAGPCINIIPVRLRMECDKALELLRQVHDQGLASMPFETFSFDRIVGSCTDWPRWTRCSTVVQCHHESIIQGATTFSGQDCRLTANDPPSDLADLVVDAMPDVDHEKEMKIAFHSNDDNIPSDMIDRMADLLSANIQLLGKDLETALPSVASSTIQWISNPKEQHKEQRTKVSPKGSGQVQTTVREVWAKSLSTTWDHVFDASEPFYDLWPGPTAAVYLSERYRQAGLSIGLDEVFEHPSMSEQSQMLFE